MRRLYTPKVIIYFFILLILDATLAPIFRFGDIRFFLTYLIVIYAAFQWSWKRVLPTASVIGVLRDLMGTGPIGIETFSLIASAVILHFAVQKVEREQTILRMVCAGLFTFFVLLFQGIAYLFLTGINFDVLYYLSFSLGSSLVTGLLVPIFFFISSWWFHDRATIKQYDLFQ